MCGYLDVDVLDVIAHSLGGSLMYAVGRGLSPGLPLRFTRSRRWHRIGTFVALAGAFHGLGGGAVGEWRTDGPFITALLAERRGGGGETPYGASDPVTPGARPHRITYFCGTAVGDFVDAQQPGTGALAGADNRSYRLGPGLPGHQAIKENRAVFDDFRPLLNSVPPTDPVSLRLTPPAGSYPAPLRIVGLPIATGDPTRAPAMSAERLTTRFVNGRLVDDIRERASPLPASPDTLVLPSPGKWKVSSAASGDDRLALHTYWVDIQPVECVIDTDGAVPFSGSLLVAARSRDVTAQLYHSLDGGHWNVGATVLLTGSAAVVFRAITGDGVASEPTSRSFLQRVEWDDAVSAALLEHFLAGRVPYAQLWEYAARFGYFAGFTLYSVGGTWVLDPRPDPPGPARMTAPADAEASPPSAPLPGAGSGLTASPPSGVLPAGPITVTVAVADAVAAPRHRSAGRPLHGRRFAADHHLAILHGSVAAAAARFGRRSHRLSLDGPVGTTPGRGTGLPPDHPLIANRRHSDPSDAAAL